MRGVYSFGYVIRGGGLLFGPRFIYTLNTDTALCQYIITIITVSSVKESLVYVFMK